MIRVACFNLHDSRRMFQFTLFASQVSIYINSRRKFQFTLFASQASVYINSRRKFQFTWFASPVSTKNRPLRGRLTTRNPKSVQYKDINRENFRPLRGRSTTLITTRNAVSISHPLTQKVCRQAVSAYWMSALPQSITWVNESSVVSMQRNVIKLKAGLP